MLDPALRIQIDQLWDKFWSGGLVNPLLAIDQINYLIFLNRLEGMDRIQVQRSAATGGEYQSIFYGDFEDCRWSHWSTLPGELMLPHVRDRVFPWMKELASETHAFTQHLKDAAFLIPKASLLVEATAMIERLAISDRNIDTQGDIFEYMLGKLSVAGQIGQFRTPRHVIRAMVTLVDPAIGENVVDPACGTGGFLIAAYQHMVEKGTSPDLIETDEQGVPKNLLGDRLSADEWTWLRGSALQGNDVDPTMVRIAAMNMVLHGIAAPAVQYADSSATTYPHIPRAHVVLANPPFSGSLDQADVSDDFRFKTHKTELLFVQLIQDLLEPGGRCAVIVPQGVLRAHNDVQPEIRSSLLGANVIEAVISLPHFTFKPYAQVSTAILVFRKGGSTSKVWMYRVDNDGFSSGDNRAPVSGSDIPDLLLQYGMRHSPEYVQDSLKHRWVSRDEIVANRGELFPNVYLSPTAPSHTYASKSLAELCSIKKGKHGAASTSPGPYPLYTTAERPKTSSEHSFEGEAVLIPMVSSTGHGHASLKRLHFASGAFAAATIVAVLQPKDSEQIRSRFLHQYLSTFKDELIVQPHMSGSTNNSLSLAKIGSIEVPVPPIETQDELIADLLVLAQEREEAAAKVEQLKSALQDAVEVFKESFSQ